MMRKRITIWNWPGGLALVGLSACLASAVLAQAPPAQPQPAPVTIPAPPAVEGATVYFEGEPLYEIKGSLGPFTAQERAAAVAKLILKMADDPFFDPHSVTVVEEDGASKMMYRGQLLARMTDEDALLYGKSRQDIAAERVQIIREAIEKYRERRTPEARLQGILYAAVGGALMVLLFIGLNHVAQLHHAVEQGRADARAAEVVEREDGGPPQKGAELDGVALLVPQLQVQGDLGV